MDNKIEMIGKRFGRLTVIEESPKRINSQCAWICKCDCGNVTKPIRGASLRRGDTTSCGCVHSEVASKSNSTHKKSKTRLYNIWACVIQRCFNTKNKSYSRYGARGITVCDEWKDDFQAFHDWAMANGYEDYLTIDRIDVNGNYEPSNCRWATTKEQQNNRSNNHFVTCNNETHTLSEWAEITGVKVQTIWKRLNDGWDVKRALFEKVSCVSEEGAV